MHRTTSFLYPFPTLSCSFLCFPRTKCTSKRPEGQSDFQGQKDLTGSQRFRSSETWNSYKHKKTMPWRYQHIRYLSFHVRNSIYQIKCVYIVISFSYVLFSLSLWGKKNKRKKRNFPLPLLAFQNVVPWKFRSHIQPFKQINSQLIFKHLIFYDIEFRFSNCFFSLYLPQIWRIVIQYTNLIWSNWGK